MAKIKYDVKLKNHRKTVANAVMGTTIFEYKTRISDVRALQSALMMLGTIVADLNDHRGILILDNTKISEARLAREWEQFNKLFKQSILTRLSLVVFSNDSMTEIFGNLNDEELKAIIEIQNKLSKNCEIKRGREPSAFFEILRVLLVHWFRKSGPLKLYELSQLTGFSYPSVSSALEKIETKLIRHTDRSVELKSFPRDAWLKLLAVSDEIRSPQAYTAGRPRPIEHLINKINKQHYKAVAFGGITGARHYMPEIDLIGTSRLDLSVFDWEIERIEEFVNELDPALKPIQPGELPQIVVHRIYRPSSLFVQKEGSSVADEVECLLDLHEARMESQALEFLDYLKKHSHEPGKP